MSLCWNQGFLSSAATVGLPVFCRKEEEAQKEYEERQKKILEDAKRNHEKAVYFLRKSMARSLLSWFCMFSGVQYFSLWKPVIFLPGVSSVTLGNLLPPHQCCELFTFHMAQKDLERRKSIYHWVWFLVRESLSYRESNFFRVEHYISWNTLGLDSCPHISSF